jgi:hypothetical protein
VHFRVAVRPKREDGVLRDRFRIWVEHPGGTVAARAVAKRLRLPRSRGNDGKALVSVDLAEINHAALPARSPAGHLPETQDRNAAGRTRKAGGSGGWSDFEWERDQGHKLMAEFLKMIAVIMTAKEASARLEGELAV